jgi:hypothetical protein
VLTARRLYKSFGVKGLTSNFCISTRGFIATLSYLGGLCGCDPLNYADGSVASGSASHAGQVKGDDSDKEGYPRTSDLGLGREANNLPSVKKPHCSEA